MIIESVETLLNVLKKGTNDNVVVLRLSLGAAEELKLKLEQMSEAERVAYEARWAETNRLMEERERGDNNGWY